MVGGLCRSPAMRWLSAAALCAPLPPGAVGAVFNGVSCGSACTAAGTYFNGSDQELTLAERWNGATWTVQPTPTPAGVQMPALTGVSCAAPDSCAAAGVYFNVVEAVSSVFAEAWNGSRWRLEITPIPAGSVTSYLAGISCAPGRCTAVGYNVGLSTVQVTLGVTART
jgi:hypothetical protein